MLQLTPGLSVRLFSLFLSLNLLFVSGVSGQRPDSTLTGKDTARPAVQLQKVTVTGRKALMDLRPDKLVIRVDAALTNAGSTALEVLEKSPGITLDKDGNISLKGKSGVLILLDGKPTYLTGGDLSNLLSGMSASQLEEIEIMTNPPARYDAAGNAGVINIRTKKNRTRGWNGNLTTGYGQGTYWKTNNSLSLNYRNDRYNLFLLYSINAYRSYTDLYLTRKYLGADAKTVLSLFEEPNMFTRKTVSNNAKLGMDYFLSGKTTLGWVATGFITTRNSRGDGTGYLQDANGHTDSIANTLNQSDNTVKNGAINLNLRHAFDSAHEVSVDADYIQYNNTGPQLFTNTSSYPDGTVTAWGQLRGDLPAVIRIWSGKADYSQTLAKGTKLEAGWKSSFVRTDNAADYFNLSGQAWEPDYSKTNHFLYREDIHAGYLNLSMDRGRWSFQGGLRYEQTHYTGHQLGNPQKPDSSFLRSYQNLFPTLFLSYRVNTAHLFSISGGRRIDRPAYQDLNPFLFFINQYTYQTGNPFLQPQYTTNLELSHQFRSVFTTTLGYANTSGYFTQIFTSSGNTSIISQGNLGRLLVLSLSMNAQLNPRPWWSMSLSADISHKKVDGFAGGLPVRSEGVFAQFNTNNQFRWAKVWSGELSGFFNSREVEGQFVTRPFWQLSLGVARQVLHNKGVIKLNVQDLFYSNYFNSTIDYQNVREHFIQRRDSRVINLGFVYKWGKLIRDTRKGGAGEEQNRVRL